MQGEDMGFTVGSAFRGIILAKQTAFGTAASSGWAFGEIDDESFKTNYDIITKNDVSRYGAAKTDTGKKHGEGSINMALDTSMFTGLMLTGMFPKSSISGSGPYTHVLEEIDHASAVAGSNTDYPVFDIQIIRDEKGHRFTSQVLNRMSIRANTGEYVMVSADFMGKSEGEDSQTSPFTISTLDDEPHNIDAMHFAGATVVFDDGSGNTTASDKVSSIELEINLNRNVDVSYSLGQNTCVRAPPPQLRTITGTVEFSKVVHTDTYDEPTYAELIADGGATYNPSSSTPAIKLVFVEGSETITLDLFKVRWEAPESTISGRDVQTMRVGFQALFDEGGAEAMAKCTIVSNNMGSAAL